MARRNQREATSAPAVAAAGPAPLRIQYWPLARLQPSPRNARTHSEAQVAQLVGIIQKFGFTNPILVGDDGEIIAGHARLMAAQQLAMASVPVIVLAGLNELQRRQLMLADNKLALNSGWDEALLAVELQDLRTEGIDLAALGFDAAELDKRLSRGQAENPAEEATPEKPAVPTSRAGDIWQLGRHRVGCGDSTNRLAVRALLAGVAPKLMVTDPPYGVNYDPSWREGADLGIGQRSKGKVRNDDRADWHEAWALFPGLVAYVWHGGLHSGTVEQSLIAEGFLPRAQIIWVKQHFVLSRGDYHWQHEPCWYAVRKGAESTWAGDRKQVTVWEIANNNSFGNSDKEETWGHGTQKPVECMRRPMLNNSKPGAAIYDPFLGSGTTIIAAETCGRIGIGMELDPGYADVAVMRWEKLTGKKAVLQGDGRDFDAIAADRHSAKTPQAKRPAKDEPPPEPVDLAAAAK